MTNKRKKKKATGEGFIGRLFAQTKLPAHVTEEQDWYLDTPDVRLTRVFTIVLVLHVVAVGGILAFKMIEKASTPAAVVEASSLANAGASDDSANSSSTEEDTGAASTAGAEETAATQQHAGLLVDHPSLPEYQQYRVAAGENIVGIARRLKMSASELREANQLADGDRLNPGKWLLVPKDRKGAVSRAGATPESAVAAATPEPEPATIRPIETPPAAAAAEPASTPAAGTLGHYQVQKGDTFFAISKQFGVHYKELMAFNDMDAQDLKAGMRIKIPKQ